MVTSLKKIKKIRILVCPKLMKPTDYGIKCDIDKVEHLFFGPARKHALMASLSHG